MKSTMNRSMQWAANKQVLLQQMSEVEEIRSQQMEQYVLQHTLEHKRLEQMLEQYIKHLQALVAMHEPPQQPLVLLNHEIEILYVEDGFTDKLCIVLPQYVDLESGKISLLSPVGQQLLLAPLHSELELQTPAGLARIKIVTIAYAAA